MLKRIVHPTGVVTFQSSMLTRLGLPHAFTTRIGGVSVGPYESLNLGAALSGPNAGPSDTDSASAIAENYRRLKHALGIDDRTIAKVHQVHGPVVQVSTSANLDPSCKADSVITSDTKLAASVRVADCVPILIASRDGKTVAAVHAGWRGVVSGVIPNTIARITSEFHVQPGDLVAAIGPCIGVDHFEVGVEVAEAFEQASLPHAIVRDRWPKPHIDLPLACFEQLERAGLGVESIDLGNLCTFRDKSDFYSHRRDQGVSGRMIAIIATQSSHS